ncbi:MAG TPA: DUF3592 domain-containing protein [Candidatus Polarisedimenticolia bacterium]|nr:DUF3592 domain-containing protein [Candidatus Polarisedimenticolia bacterium]
MHILFLWVGIPFIAVGALIVLGEMKARRGAIAVRGRVVGFSSQPGDSGNSYHVVAEYEGLDGRGRLIESAIGCSVPISRVGDALQVLVRPEEPDNALVKSSATYVLGITLASMGAVCCWIFFATFRADLFSILTSVGVTAFGAYKVRGLATKAPVSLRAWMALKDKAIRGRVVAAESRGQIAWADAATLQAAIRRQQRTNRFAWPVLVLGGAGLLVLGLHLHRSTSAFLARAVPATGRVVELAENDSSDGVTYAPVVEFETRGERHRFKDTVSSNPPSYRTGDVVQVFYDPAEARKARVDRGSGIGPSLSWWERWGRFSSLAPSGFVPVETPEPRRLESC